MGNEKENISDSTASVLTYVKLYECSDFNIP